MAGDAAGRRHRPTLAERREARADIEDPAEVLNAAARYLEARPRSTAEVRRRLTSMGFRPPLVDQAVTRMTDLGYLDDDAFARSWVASRDRARPRGAHALRRELQLKGVDREVIDAVLDEREAPAVGDALDRGDRARRVDGTDAAGEAQTADEAGAERLLAKKLPSLLREQDPRKRLQRAYALLARNGFAPDVCSSVSRRVLADSGAADAST